MIGEISASRVPLLASIAVVLAVGLLGGCGDNGDDTSAAGAGGSAGSSGGSQSSGDSGSGERAEEGSSEEGASGDETAFIEEADAICTDARARINKEIRQYFTTIESLRANAAKIANTVIIPGLEEEIEEIQALESAGEASEAEAALIGGLEGMLNAAQKNPKGFVLSPTAASESEKVARGAGFQSCGGVV